MNYGQHMATRGLSLISGNLKSVEKKIIFEVSILHYHMMIECFSVK